jgi:hypothetical protein
MNKKCVCGSLCHAPAQVLVEVKLDIHALHDGFDDEVAVVSVLDAGSEDHVAQHFSLLALAFLL